VFISVKAGPNTANNIEMYYFEVRDEHSSVWDHAVADSAGVVTRVTEPPSCYPVERIAPTHPLKGKAVVCPDGSSQEFENDPTHSLPGLGEDFHVLLGDRDDRFSALDSIGEFVVYGGPGNDKVYGENAPILQIDQDTETSCNYFSEDELHGDGGNDRLFGRFGPDFLVGGSGNDYLRGRADSSFSEGGLCLGFDEADSFRGGSGNDTVWAADGDRDQSIDCGPGRRDRAIIDQQDLKPMHCERVRRHRD